MLWLDERGTIPIKPDFTWMRDGTPAAVIDAKYKALKPSGFPNADRYQMLAYCTALALPVGHLVYAKGDDAESSAVIRNANIAITLPHGQFRPATDDVLAQVADISNRIASPWR